jgi:hypothetical protein
MDIATCVRHSICSAVVVQQIGSFGVGRGSPRPLEMAGGIKFRVDSGENYSSVNVNYQSFDQLLRDEDDNSDLDRLEQRASSPVIVITSETCMLSLR